MKTWTLLLFFALLPVPGQAPGGARAGSVKEETPPGHHDMADEPRRDKEIRKHSGRGRPESRQDFGARPVHDNEIFAVFSMDRLEYQSREGEAVLLWDAEAWAGSDYNKLHLESEGEWLIDGDEFEEAEIELFYGRNVATFWDLKLGLRHDFEPEPTRTFAVLGIQGLAPYWVELEAVAYLSEDGDISANLEAEYDLLLSQRLILQPRFEIIVAVQEVDEYGVGQGINDIDLGLRLRYEIRREFAPYIGVSWSRTLGETADQAEAEGEDIDVTSFVVGVKFWF